MTVKLDSGGPMTLVDAVKRYRLQLVGVLLIIAAVYHQIISDMVSDWYRDENYSHGFLVPLIAGWFLWERREKLKEVVVAPSNIGLIVIFYSLLQLLIAWLGSEYFTMRSSLIILLAGMVLFWFGKAALKALALPIGYLIFMVPIPYIIYDAVAFPLKLFVTKFSVAFLKLIGVVVVREGNIIMFPTTTLEVADACSGIRSLMSLLALGVAYAFFSQDSSLKRLIVILSAIPIAILTNALRVIVTGILAQWWGSKAAEGFFHEFAGMVVFVLAMALLILVGAVLRRVRL